MSLNFSKILALFKLKLKMYALNVPMLCINLLFLALILHSWRNLDKGGYPEEFYINSFRGFSVTIMAFINHFFLIITTANFVSREREQGVIKASIFAGVSKLDYFFGTALPIFLVSSAYSTFLVAVMYREGIPNYFLTLFTIYILISQSIVLAMFYGLLTKNSFQSFLYSLLLEVFFFVTPFMFILMAVFLKSFSEILTKIALVIPDFYYYNAYKNFVFDPEAYPITLFKFVVIVSTFLISFVLYLFLYDVKKIKKNR